MSYNATRKEDIAFLNFAIQRVWRAAGASELHASYVADAICFAHKQGKLNQGLGVYEAIDIALELGLLDIKAEPQLINEGPSWAVIDGKRSSGYWVLNMMADVAIEKARDHGISIVFGGNHNDAGSFASYVYKAYEQDMMAMASNNSVPLAAPYGGMHNKLSCPPFDAISPSNNKPPVWTSIAMAEFYDADVAESYFQDKPLKGKWLIDPESGELTDDVKPYAKPLDGYGRVADCSAAGQIQEPRTYALNMWLESMTALINPLGIPSTQLPSIDELTDPDTENTGTTVGGSVYICINPAVFGSIDAAKARSDAYVSDIEACKPRPGHSVRIPGSKGYTHIKSEEQTIEVITEHWNAFFNNIAARYELSEESLRKDYGALV